MLINSKALTNYYYYLEFIIVQKKIFQTFLLSMQYGEDFLENAVKQNGLTQSNLCHMYGSYKSNHCMLLQ